MKQKTILLAVICAALVGIVASARPSVNTYLAPAKINRATAGSFWADGGYPIPPIPPGTGLSANSPSSSWFADGGYPIPPIPPGTGSTLKGMVGPAA